MYFSYFSFEATMTFRPMPTSHFSFKSPISIVADAFQASNGLPDFVASNSITQIDVGPILSVHIQWIDIRAESLVEQRTMGVVIHTV